MWRSSTAYALSLLVSCGTHPNVSRPWRTVNAGWRLARRVWVNSWLPSDLGTDGRVER